MKTYLPLLILLMATFAGAQDRVLVYTHNGKGYVHDNIAASVAAIQKIGATEGFAVDVSDEPAVFSDKNLAKYKTLIFSNSNNEAFTSDQEREAFRKFIHAGGGFVGIHSAAGSERTWPYFVSVLGGSFAGHPHIQTFTVHTARSQFPGMKAPTDFQWTDECYFFKRLSPDIQPLLTTDKSEIVDTEKVPVDLQAYPEQMPLAWTNHFDNGREFYIALGHSKEMYENPLFLNLLTAAILWANAHH